MLLIFSFFLSFLNAVLASDDTASEVRPRSISLKLGAAREGYRSQNLGAQIGITPDWALTGSLFLTQNDVTSGSSEFRLGGDWQGSESSFGFYSELIFRKEPNDVSARGLSGGGSWILSDLWQSKLQTTLSFDLQFLSYAQGDNFRQQRIDGTSIPQSSFTLEIMQDITSSLLASIGGTLYGYSGADDEALNDALEDRPGAFDGLLAIVDGFPESSIFGQLSWDIFSDWTVAANFSTTKLTNTDSEANRIESLGFGVIWVASSNWSFSLDASGAQTNSGEKLGGFFQLGVKTYF